MSVYDPDVIAYVLARERDGAPCRLAPSAFAHGPVADTAEPVAPQPVVTRSDSDGNDSDAVRCPERIRFHERNATIHRCVGVAGHTTYHWWSREGEQAWDARRPVPLV